MLQGLDCSHHNGEIDWQAVKDAGAVWAAIKMSQGSSFTDPMAAKNLAGAKAAGVLSMPYHYFEPGDDPVAQVRHFIEACGGHLKGLLLPALDVELDGNQRTMAPAEYVAGVMAWRHAFAAKVGHLPVIYSYRDFWTWLGGPDMSGSKLWIARYGVDTPGTLAGWGAAKIWQYTDHGSWPGVPGQGTVDLDRFLGTLDELKGLLL